MRLYSSTLQTLSHAAPQHGANDVAVPSGGPGMRRRVGDGNSEMGEEEVVEVNKREKRKEKWKSG